VPNSAHSSNSVAERIGKATVSFIQVGMELIGSSRVSAFCRIAVTEFLKIPEHLLGIPLKWLD
jgi:hypothetical protein